MTITESAGLTDPGRKRRRNEDAYVVDPPLFAVADGMGGAQAGEVASRLAAASFREFHEADELDAEERVAAIIQEANRRIYQRAQGDTLVSGMGTTVTAALVGAGRIAIGHVGDSRAYLLRDEGLEQLTEDHSLVADLIRSGQLTAEEAETHPQRSVITRALGTDADVDVDTFSVDVGEGDVLLLCSDGLTSMLDDEEISRIVRESASLETAGRSLVRAANRSGGEDNITVVLVRVSKSEVGSEEEVALEPDELEDTLSGLESPPELRQAAPPEEETAVWSPVPAAAPAPSPSARRARAGLRWGRGFLIVAVAILLVLAVLAGALWGLSRANFVGVSDEGRLAVYQGVPWDVGGGVRLYRVRYVSQVRAVQLSPAERAELLDHDLVDYGKARSEIRRYEAEGVP